jgi:hypothetical protein
MKERNLHKALQDLSISLLINETNENIDAYFHRGFYFNLKLGNVYTQLKLHENAASDYMQGN